MIADLAGRTETAVTWMGGITAVIVLFIGLALLLLALAAVLSTLANRDTSGGGKLLWVIFILWFPLFGAVAWFTVGRKGHLNRFLGIDKGRSRHKLPSSVGQHSNVANDRNRQGGDGSRTDNNRIGLSQDWNGMGGDRNGMGPDRSGMGADRSGMGADRSGMGPDRSGMGADRSGMGPDRSGMGPDRNGAGRGWNGMGHDRNGMGHV